MARENEMRGLPLVKFRVSPPCCYVPPKAAQSTLDRVFPKSMFFGLSALFF